VSCFGARPDRPAHKDDGRIGPRPSSGARAAGKAGLGALFAVVCLPRTALAHGTEGGIVLLLPTGYYLAGAALAVAASFLLLAALPGRVTGRLATASIPLGTVRDVPKTRTSLLGLTVLIVLVVAGLTGSADPVTNPLPTTVWTLWWVCFTVAQGITGPLWPHLNPWTGILNLLGRGGQNSAVVLPGRVGYGIAILQFAGFAWFELVDLAPSDPGRLAVAVSLYVGVNLAGALVFGERDWMGRAEPFSILFRLIGTLSPLSREPEAAGRTRLTLVWPGRALIDHPPLPLSGALLVLLALSTVSFDGLSRTFLWLGSIGVNPLEFPGRSAVVLSSTLGMAAAFVLLSAAFLISVALGAALVGRPDLWRRAAGRLVFSIVPIALAFQAAHYLTNVLVDGQAAIIALSDPFGLGWNLFGTAGWRVTTSFLNTLDGVTLIFDSETAIIALGHVVGIVMAHLIAIGLFESPREAVRSQIPLAMLMVFYTGFGLWLLSTPRI
jgi:hypothetical protein